MFSVPGKDGRTIMVTINDAAKEMSDVRPASTAEQGIGQAQLIDDDSRLVPLDDHTALLAWIGSVCDKGMQITIEPTRIVLHPAPRPGCDLARIPYSIVMTDRNKLPNDIVVELLRPELIGG